MLFGGGMDPWYITYVNMFDLKNTIFAMIIPNLLLSAFNVLLMRRKQDTLRFSFTFWLAHPLLQFLLVIQQKVYFSYGFP